MKLPPQAMRTLPSAIDEALPAKFEPVGLDPGLSPGQRDRAGEQVIAVLGDVEVLESNVETLRKAGVRL